MHTISTHQKEYNLFPEVFLFCNCQYCMVKQAGMHMCGMCVYYFEEQLYLIMWRNKALSSLPNAIDFCCSQYNIHCNKLDENGTDDLWWSRCLSGALILGNWWESQQSTFPCLSHSTSGQTWTRAGFRDKIFLSMMPIGFEEYVKGWKTLYSTN